MQQSQLFHDDTESEDSDQALTPSPFSTSQEGDEQLFSSQFDIMKCIQTPDTKRASTQPKKRIQSKFISEGNLTAKNSKQYQSPASSKKKAQVKKIVMKELKPLNLESEKERFFALNGVYNPQFEYANTQNLENQFMTVPHQKYSSVAIQIIKSCLAEFGSEVNFSEKEGGPLMTKEQVEKCFQKYIDEFNVRELISFEFSTNTVAPTSVIHSNQDNTSRVIIGLPITYRTNRIQGVLDHEIGTHFVRKYNDKKQIWYKRRNKFTLQPHIKNEEGLAVLNQTVSLAQRPNSKPYLYTASIHYIAAIMAAHMSFSQLYKGLQDFLPDKEKRFRECLRVKRGIADTSTKGGMYKDQVYLIGVLKVLKYRNKINFLNLHAGKITVKDCLRLSEKGLIATEKLKVPLFLKDMVSYRKALDRIAEVNHIA